MSFARAFTVEYWIDFELHMVFPLFVFQVLGDWHLICSIKASKASRIWQENEKKQRKTQKFA